MFGENQVDAFSEEPANKKRSDRKPSGESKRTRQTREETIAELREAYGIEDLQKISLILTKEGSWEARCKEGRTDGANTRAEALDQLAEKLRS